MTFALTAPYAILLTLIYVVLLQLTIKARTRTTISLGDGGDLRLLEASRRQMNFVENIPLALILMLLAEAGGASPLMMNIAGNVLVIARIVHPFGITMARPAHPLRIGGSVATTLVQLGLCVILILQHFA